MKGYKYTVAWIYMYACGIRRLNKRYTSGAVQGWNVWPSLGCKYTFILVEKHQSRAAHSTSGE